MRLASIGVRMRVPRCLVPAFAKTAFIHRGSSSCFFRGTALTYALCPALDLRIRGDTDIIFPADRRDDTFNALVSFGFASAPHSSGSVIAYRKEFSRWDAGGVPLMYTGG